ncbi:MAG: penicillin-binding transpeptidase domain-containing protein [Luteolibacter sp.]|uniref:peptidoglycan D,D-transpeptidase FtsI family protein n=1 Tax=Luteolibacter sp. TaxID=1962973 RepID=UPI003263AEF2
MEPGYRLRLYLLTALVLVGFGTLLSRLYEFQIERKDYFLQLVPGNRNVTIREPGIRGEITDRNDIPLARNLRRYEVSFNLDEIRQAYMAQHAEEPKKESIVTEKGLPRSHTEKDIVAIVNEGTIERLRKLGLAKNYRASNLKTHYITHGGLIPFSYRADLTYEEFSKFAEHNLDLPGVYLSLRPQRQYPYGALASHELGYLKQWEKGDVPESATRKYDHYIGDDKGIAGVEATMDDFLRGPEGKKTVVKDEKGRTIKVSDYIKPGVGANVKLTIDAPVQYLLENTLRHAGRAAGIVMDVNTGEVLAMASVPDFDPNDFFPSITQKNLDDYKANKLSPLSNRAISRFTPGSTMKIPTAISGALEGMANKRFNCNGYVMYGNAKVGCWIYNMHGGSHGNQNLSEAIQHSCNPYFNTLANSIGWEKMVTGCSMVSIGRQTGIELPKEDPGILPGSRAWRAMFPTATMTQHEVAGLSIGQGTSMATPLQMCAVAATVANGGKYYKPRIVKEAVTVDGKVVVEDVPKLQVDLIQSGIKPEDFELIRKGMRMSANEPGGTSGKIKLPDILIAAKSGTAQTSDFGKKSNNSWIISFAPYDHPKYAVCVMVQNGASGGGVAGPLANLIYRGLFARDNKGIRLPLKPQTKVPGYIGELVKTIEISPEMIAAVEAGDTDPTPAAISSAAYAPPVDPATEEAGETGEEAGDLTNAIQPPPVSDVTPAPTITPEVDAEGSVIPKAVPVKDP